MVVSCKVASCKVTSCKVASCKVASCTGIQYRLLFGFFLLYTDRVPFELLDSAALL
jgi:hypothetical protein